MLLVQMGRLRGNCHAREKRIIGGPSLPPTKATSASCSGASQRHTAKDVVFSFAKSRALPVFLYSYRYLSNVKQLQAAQWLGGSRPSTVMGLSPVTSCVCGNYGGFLLSLKHQSLGINYPQHASIYHMMDWHPTLNESLPCAHHEPVQQKQLTVLVKAIFFCNL